MARKRPVDNRRRTPLLLNRKGGGGNALRYDPTRTIALRRAFAAEVNRRWSRVKAAVLRLVGDVHPFGLSARADKLDNRTESGSGLLHRDNSAPRLSVTNSNPDQPRDDRGRFAPARGGGHKSVLDRLKALGASVGHLEHSLKAWVTDRVGRAVAKLPERLQTVVNGAFHVGKVVTAGAFASWTAGQKLAERVARERGATEEQARRLRGILSTLDFTSFKPIALGMGAAGLGSLVLPASFVPPATAGYLAYSTARNPLATARAAKAMVAGGAGAAYRYAKGKLVGNELLGDRERGDLADLIAATLADHGWEDWYVALFSAALDHTRDVRESLRLASAAFARVSNPGRMPEPGGDDGEDLFPPPTVNADFTFRSDPDKVVAFQNWLRERFEAEGVTGGSAEELWRRYARSGYLKGAGRAFTDARGVATGEATLDSYVGSKDEFLRSAFARPVAQEKIELLAGRAFDDLENVTEDVSTRMSRSLTDALVGGKSPREAARDLAEDCDLGRDRAQLIARTEIVRCHAEGQLDALEALGVDEVGVEVEWSTAGDGKVCELCSPLEDVVLPIDRARNLLPRHPNCRCAWVPANVGEKAPEGRKAGKDAEDALEESGLDVDLSANRLGPPTLWDWLSPARNLADDGGGRWVTLGSGQHVYITGAGTVSPHGPGGDDGRGEGRGEGGRGAPEAGGRVAGEAGAAGGGGEGGGGGPPGEPAGDGAAQGVPGEAGPTGAGVGPGAAAVNPPEHTPEQAAVLEVVNARIGRMERFFESKGQHEQADWMRQLREHVNAVGPQDALESLGGSAGGTGRLGNEPVQYEGRSIDMGDFCERYLQRVGVAADVAPYFLGSTRFVGSSSPAYGGLGDTGRERDFSPRDPTLRDKLEEAKSLPGLERSEDLSKLVGKEVTHLTPDVTARLDSEYGKGQWIVKPYQETAFAGHGIFFPQRAERIAQEARDAVWQAGESLDRYGFKLARHADTGEVQGLVHESGDAYHFGTPEYENTIGGDARHWADRAREASRHERGAELPDGGQGMMAQPAFPVVGVSDAERAAGVTFKTGQEGRVHVITRDGVAEVVPHSTWLKNESLPVVFESEDTRAMAKAAKEAIEALPHSERRGQVYAPDIVKTADGYKVVEANPANDTGSSGYLGDNPMVIDSYVSHVTGRDPEHVRFVRGLLERYRPVRNSAGDVVGWHTWAGDLTHNAFCPTGAGGGQDNSCSNHPTRFVEGEGRKKASAQVLDRLSEMEDAGTDGTKEYNALEVMYKALAGGRSHAVVAERDGRITAAGVMTLDSNGETASIDFIGSVEKGGGSSVMAALLDRARSAGRKVVRADASPDAVPLNRKFGFQVVGKLGPNGTPMALTLTHNAFCPTGPGGGVDPGCPVGGGTAKSKFVGAVVGAASHALAEGGKYRVAKMVGGVPEELTDDAGQRDKKPYDVKIDHTDAIEVKTLNQGGKQSLSVHEDALLRKVEYLGAHPGETFHTVAIDNRETSFGGAHSGGYSGHGLYYKRGSGRYTLSQMHRVSSAAELKRLIKAADHELPEKAKGSLPSGAELKKLRDRAEKASASRKARDGARKARPEVQAKLKEQARLQRLAKKGGK